MSAKRKRGDEGPRTDVVSRPVAGTKSFKTGTAVRDGLATGTRQALVSFHQQIVTPYSSLPLAITHPTVLILQHYLDASPTADEIFNAWKLAEELKNEKLAEASALLLALVIRILTPLPFFHTQVVGIVSKLVASTEPYNDLLARLLSSAKRENVLAGLSVAAAAVHVDAPDPTNLLGGGARGRLAGQVWASIAEGGNARALGKMLGMRRRNRDGSVEYGDRDPLDKPDIRHLAIDLILPLLPTTAFHTHAKPILHSLYGGLEQDPPATIYRVLSAMWAAVSGPPPGMARRISLVLLDEGAVENIAKLLDRPEAEPETGRAVADIAQGFLDGVTTNTSRGICFPDEGWYPREEEGDERKRRGLHNRILSNVVRKLGARVVADDEGRVGSWALKMFAACPELVAGYWPNSALALDPRLDTKWIATVAYVGRVVSLPLPPRSTFNQPAPRGTNAASMPPRAIPPVVATIIESVLPSPLTKQHLSKGLQHADYLVQHVTALALARCLQKLASVQALFATISAELDEGLDGPWRARARELELECRRRVPEVPVVIAFAQKSATMARPKDENDEVDPALTAKSAMLTEAALRLFGLYHKTLPTLAGEARFDVGKLLVSASSANAERRARREAREGSVVSDSGSVGSVGTLGTVGMGGGFGHTRGDVEGFEALSQLHVLRLLSEVRDWSWTNKAAGSQYTYLYHILQLHLSTRNVVTQAMTTTLLHRLLLSSLLFEHDALELPIWLDALPRASETVSGPMFVAQQIHLLAFLDECVRRALKTPHRYIEEAATVVPDLPAVAVASPLLMTVVEQLHAKLIGMHIATEAAAVVLNYLRRVLLGLLGKQAAPVFVQAIVARFDASVKAARDAGQPRHGLPEIVELMEGDLAVVFKAAKMPTIDAETPRLVDEDDYTERSFTRQCLLFATGASELPTIAHFVNTATLDDGARQAQYLVHFLHAKRDAHDVLRLLGVVLSRVPTPATSVGDRMKAAVFNDSIIRDLFLTAAGDDYRTELATMAATLSLAPFDRALAEHYTYAALEMLSKKKKTPDTLVFAALQPWIKFLAPAQVVSALSQTLKRASKAKTGISELASAVLGALVVASRPDDVYPHLAALLALGAYRPVASLLRSAVAASLSRRLDAAIGADLVVSLVSKGDDDAYALLALLVSLSPSAADAFSAALPSHSEWLADARVLPALAEVASTADHVRTAVSALASPTQPETIYTAATTILAASAADDVNAALASVTMSQFGLPLARAAAALARTHNALLAPAVTSLLKAGLQAVTRVLSSDSPLAGDEEAILVALGEAVSEGSHMRVEVDALLAEPAITAVVAERLDVPSALEFGALLASQAMLKAGFVRQQLQVLFASKQVARGHLGPSSDPDAAHRLAFVRLLHALFLASTYVSCQPNFIEPLVPLYGGTLGTADRLILSLLQAFEAQRKLSVTSVLSHWSPSGAVSRRALDAVTSLDAQRVFATCTAFPLRRGYVDDAKTPADEQIYDPAFVLPLLAAALHEELTGLDWVEILRSNTLGLAVCALASRDKGMRATAGYVLSTAVARMRTVHFHEQLQLLHTLELVAHAIPAPAPPAPGSPDADTPELRQPRLPTLIALFIAHALRAIAHPGHFLYPISSRFLLQRPTLDAADVPGLYGMLYASGDGARRERAWIVRLLRDGVRSDADARILARRNTVALLSSLFQSSLDAGFRRHVLGAIGAIVRVPRGARSVLHALPWLVTQWDAAPTRPSAHDVRAALLDILEDAIATTPATDKQPRWTSDAARLVSLAANDADADRLYVLARIAFRLARAGDVSALPALVHRLEQLPSAIVDSDADTPDTDGTTSVADKTTELMFRASLCVPSVPADVGLAVRRIVPRVAKLEGEVGQWARSEARRV